MNNIFPRILTLAFGTLTLFAMILAANAQNTYFPNNVTINYSVPSLQAVIGYDNDTDYNAKAKGTSPVINFANGGRVEYCFAFNSSQLNITGGNIGIGLQSFDSSKVTISGGDIQSLTFAANNSMVNVSSGILGDTLECDDNSVANVIGGSLQNSLIARNNSTINFSGGSVADYVFSDGASAVNITGGSVNISVTGEGSGTINVRGGASRFGYSAFDSSTINLFGTGLGFSQVIDTGFLRKYTLYGNLLDGTSINGKVFTIYYGSGAKFSVNNIVPEPGSMAFLVGMMAGGVMALRRRFGRS